MKPNYYFILLFFALVTSSFSCVHAQNGQVRGTVIDKNGEPLPGATIYIPSLNAGAYANDIGVFSIARLPEGRHSLWATYVGYDTLKKEINITASEKILTEKLVLYERDFYTDEVQIFGEQTGKIETKKVNLGKVQFNAKEIKMLPSIGAPDLMQYLQVLPGVVFTGDQGGQLYIRGGTPIQNMTMLDGMIIYSPFHSIGLFSVFDPEYIRSVDVYSAGFPAKYGGRISSVIDVKTRNGNFNQVKGRANVNPFSTNAFIEGPLMKSKRDGAGVSFMLSGRKNYIDKTSTTIYPHVNDSTGLPYNFTDVYGKITVSDGANFANIFAFRHEDNANFEFPANIGWSSGGGGANFMLLPQGAGAIIRGNFAYSNYSTSLKSESEAFPRASGISGFNGGLDVSYIVNSVDEVSGGLTLLGFGTDYRFTNSFGYVTDITQSNTELAAYFSYKKVFQTRPSYSTSPDSTWDLIVLEPSIRVHFFNDQGSVAEPRIRLKLNLPKASLSFAAGMYNQNLMAGTSDRDVVNLFQGFLSAPIETPANTTRNNNLQAATHLVGGLEFEILPNLSTNIEAWYKDFTQLTNINREKLFPEEPNFIVETGEAYGVDLVLKYQIPELYLYGTYGYAKVTRDDLTQIYPPVWDRRHTVNFVGAYRLKRFGYRNVAGRKVAPKFKEHAWEFSLRWTMGSGFPFTQTQGYFEKITFLGEGAQTDIATQNGQLGLLLADELNGGRLPYYHRLDLSAKRKWIIKNSWLLEVNASLINTYDRDNIFYFDRVRFQPVYQLPVLPSLGLTIAY